MKTFALSVIVGLSLGVAAPAAADVLTSRVVNHDAASHVIVLRDKSVVNYNPATVQMPVVPEVGDMVRIEFSGSEGDMSRILSITTVIE